MGIKNLARLLVLGTLISSSLASQGCSPMALSKEHLIYNPIYNSFFSSRVNRLREDAITALKILNYSSYYLSELQEDRKNLRCVIKATRRELVNGIEQFYTAVVKVNSNPEELEVVCLDAGEAKFLRTEMINEIKQRDQPKYQFKKWP